MAWINATYYGFLFVFGLCIGSFLNVCVYRIPRHISIARGRSMCPSCGHSLNAADLVPVLSYLFLGRKCRYCRARISPRYMIGELLCACAFALLGVVYGFSLAVPIYMLFFTALFCVGFIDADTGEIPDRFSIIIAAASIPAFFLIKEVSWLERVIGLAAVSLPMLILSLTISGFGMGDVKLMAASGLLLGWKAVLLAFCVGVIGAAFYIVPKMLTHSLRRHSHIPFGPFLCSGLAIAALVGPQLIAWYEGLLYIG